MTQEIMTDISQDNVSSAPILETEVAPAAPAEKMVPQSQVDRLVKTIKMKDEQRMQNLIQQYEAEKTHSPSLPSNNNSWATKDDVAAILQDTLGTWAKQAEQAQQEQEAHSIVDSFTKKMSTGKERYSDFEDVSRDINYQTIPKIVEEIAKNNIDVDVFYELAKNKPLEIMNIEHNLRYQPAKAKEALTKLSNSIKINENAKNVQRPNEPIRQLTPSNIGIDSGSDSNLSVGDFKKIKPWKT